MSNPLKVAGTPMAQDVLAAIRQSIETAIAECHVEVSGGGGHYTIVATSPAFAGKNRLESQRMVLRAIRPLMDGDAAPVHAVDSITTRTP